jgi:hypothetical protein
VLALLIMVCPVDHTTFRVPLILTKKRDSITTRQCFDAWSDIYVVCNEQGLTGGKPEDEALMAASVVVIRKNPIYHTFAVYLNATLLGLERFREFIFGRRRGTCKRLAGAVAIELGIDE